MKKILATLLVLYTQQLSADKLAVPITNELSSFETLDSGHKIEVKRIQDFDNKLVDDFTKTSRACPPFCIQPTNIQEVQSIAELEVIKFMKTKVKNNKGLLIDARLQSWFELETIPSAINIPFSLMETNKADKILQLLGTKMTSDGKKDFTKAKELVLFANGAWSAQSSKFISIILAKGYPKNKIMSYRDGLQGWKLLGLTTVIHKEIK